MSKAELVQKIKNESEECSPKLLLEILNYIHYKKGNELESITYNNNIILELTNLTDISLLHLENEFSGYQERYPRE